MEPLILGTNGSVAAVDPATGELFWSTPLKTSGTAWWPGRGGSGVMIHVESAKSFVCISPINENFEAQYEIQARHRRMGLRVFNPEDDAPA